MSSSPDVFEATQRHPTTTHAALPLESKTVQPTAALPDLSKGETLATLLTPTKPAVPDPGFVHLGSVRIEAKVFEQFKVAEERLGLDVNATKMLSVLVHGDKPTTIVGIDKNDGQGDRFEPAGSFGKPPVQEGGTIFWNPTGANLTTEGEVQSPALGLLHEQGHAVEWHTDPAGLLKGAGEKNQRFTNAEEQRNERGPEAHTATVLGEPVRRNHLGHDVEVSGPTSRTPIPVPKIERTPEQLKEAIDGLSKFYRANGYDSTAPAKDAASVRPWDHKTHTGSFMTLDQNTVVQYVGRGQYEVYDVQKDLGGKFPPENAPLTIDAKGHVQSPQLDHEQTHAR